MVNTIFIWCHSLNFSQTWFDWKLLELQMYNILEINKCEICTESRCRHHQCPKYNVLGLASLLVFPTSVVFILKLIESCYFYFTKLEVHHFFSILFLHFLLKSVVFLVIILMQKQSNIGFVLIACPIEGFLILHHEEFIFLLR